MAEGIDRVRAGSEGPSGADEAAARAAAEGRGTGAGRGGAPDSVAGDPRASQGGPERAGRLTVARVRELFAEARQTDESEPSGEGRAQAELARLFADDARSQVGALVRSTLRRLERERAERDRVRSMYDLQRELGGPGLLLGVDEVGRGSIAGPLAVGAVALPNEPIVWGVNDSKQLTPERREELAARIRDVALAVGIGYASPEEIDACGMAACLRMAMRRAIEASGVDPACVLIDGLPVHVHPREVTLPHGDARVACIAAASIVAKVDRDALMVRAEQRYPGYGFAASKGYASPEHIAAIRERGLTDFHRASFCTHFTSPSGA